MSLDLGSLSLADNPPNIVPLGGGAGAQLLPSRPSREESITLYVGGLPPYTTAQGLAQLFQQWGPRDVKVVKDKCYGFVTFGSQSCAEQAILALNGQLVSGGQTLRVNYALVPPASEERREGEVPLGRSLQPQHQIFVGDLSAGIDDAKLYNCFAKFPSCVDARVMWDPHTKRSKGFGFVTFTKLEDAGRAISELNGQLLGSRRLRCDWAQHKLDPVGDGLDEASVDRANPTSTNIYVGNISPTVDELTVTALFQEFGKVVFVRVHRKGSYGFVGFQDHWSAVKAIVGMHGKVVHDRALKCSWGTMSSFGGSSPNSSGTLLSHNTSGSSAAFSSGASAEGAQYFDLSLGGLQTAGSFPMMASQPLTPALGAGSATGGMYAMPQAYGGLMPAMAAQQPYLMPASALPLAYKPGQNTVSVAKVAVPPGGPVYPAQAYGTWPAAQGGVYSSGDLLLPTATSGMPLT